MSEGVVVGIDISGARYNGTYTLSGTMIEGKRAVETIDDRVLRDYIRKRRESTLINITITIGDEELTLQEFRDLCSGAWHAPMLQRALPARVAPGVLNDFAEVSFLPISRAKHLPAR